MEVQVYYGEHPHYRHEYDQLNEIIDLVHESDLEGPVFLLHNFLLSNSEIDCLLLCPHGMILLDLKAYQGVILGEEEGSWTVTMAAGEVVTMAGNLFHQLRVHRNDLFNRLKRVREEHFPQIEEEDLRKINAWGYFLGGSTYPEGQIDLAVVKWFDVVTRERLIDQIRVVHAGYTLRTRDMEVIAEVLRLKPAEVVPLPNRPDGGGEPQPRPTPSPSAVPEFSEDQFLRRMDALVERMEAIPVALARLNGREPACEPPTPVAPMSGGCSDQVLPDESQGPVAAAIRQFICTEYAVPARAAGHTTFSVTSGEVHTKLELTDSMAMVCGVLRGHRLEEVCTIELLEEVRRVRIRTSSASNRFIFRVLPDPGEQS
jgi:hypothetical protein